MQSEPETRRYLVRITRIPLDAERRELLQRAGRLPDDWRTRSVAAVDFVFVDAVDDRDAGHKALYKTRIQVDGGEIIEAAEIVPNTQGRSRPLPPLPSAMDTEMPKHKPIPPEEWISEQPYDYRGS